MKLPVYHQNRPPQKLIVQELRKGVGFQGNWTRRTRIWASDSMGRTQSLRAAPPSSRCQAVPGLGTQATCALPAGNGGAEVCRAGLGWNGEGRGGVGWGGDGRGVVGWAGPREGLPSDLSGWCRLGVGTPASLFLGNLKQSLDPKFAWASIKTAQTGWRQHSRG